MTTKQITETFIRTTKKLMAFGMTEQAAKAQAKAIMFEAIERMKD